MVQPQQPRGFSIVAEDPPAPQPQAPQIDNFINPPPKQPFVDAQSVRLIQLALGSLSHRAVIALASLFQLVTVASVFVLWYLTPDPTQPQIISLTIYAAFILLINYLNMRRGH